MPQAKYQVQTHVRVYAGENGLVTGRARPTPAVAMAAV